MCVYLNVHVCVCVANALDCVHVLDISYSRILSVCFSGHTSHFNT